MNLIFVDELPANVGGKYAHYKHRRVGGSRWEYCDVRKYIGQHQDKWLNDIEHWHSELSKTFLRLTKWWWLMPESRLIAWHPPHLKSFFFALALIEYCEKFNYDEVYLVECPGEVYNYLKELKPDYRLSCCQAAASQQSLEKSKIFSRQLANLKNLIMLAIRCLPKSKNLSALDKAKIVIYSHVLDAETLLQKGDHFFGPMFDELFGIDRKNILWLYLSVSGKEKMAVKQYMQSVGQNVVFLYELITLTDFIRIVLTAMQLVYNMRLVRNILPPVKVDNYESHVFSKIFVRQLSEGVLPIFELAVSFAVRRLLRSTNARVLIYPYEEKGLERAILYACRNGAKGVNTIGFAHAVYNKGHLCLRNRSVGLMNSPKPDSIAAPGPAIRSWLIDWAMVNPESVTVVGSPRYHERLPLQEDFESHQKKLRVLVIIGQGYEVDILANYLEEVADLFSDCELLIRRYPYGWESQQDEGIYRLKKLCGNIRVEIGSMLRQLSWCDVVIYSATSAGLEAMLSGRLAIYVALHDVIVLDPMEGKGDISKILRCSTSTELKAILQEIRGMSKHEYLMVLQRQYEFASQVYTQVNRENLSQLLSNYSLN